MSTISFKLLLNGGVSSGLKSAFGSISKSVAGLQDKINGLNKTASKIGQFRKLTSQLNRFRTEMDKGGTSGRKAREKWEKTAATLRELSGELKKAGVNMDDLTGAEKRLSAATDKLNGKLAKQQAHAAKQSKIDSQIQNSRQLRQGAFAGGLTGAILPVLAIGSIAKPAIDAEEKLAEIRKVANDLSEGELKKLDNDLLMMSTRMPTSYGELADITAAAAQSGIGKTREDFVKFSETAAQMGVAFDVAGGAAGKMMADWRAGMGLSQVQANQMADMVNHLSNNMNAQAGDLGEIIQRQGAIGKGAGLANNEIVALAGALKSTGARTEIAATAFKNFTNALGKGRFHSTAAQEAFEDIGLDVEKVAKQMQEDAEKAITSVLQTIKEKAPAHELNAIVGKIFGEESKGAITPLIQNMDLLKKAFTEVGDQSKYAGSMYDEFVERQKTTAAQLEKSQNVLWAFGKKLGDTLLPQINKLAEGFGSILKNVIELSEKYPKLTKAITGGTAGILGAGAAFNILKGATQFSIGGAGEAVGMVRKLATMKVGPLFVITAAIAGLVAVLNEMGALKPLKEGFLAGFQGSISDIKKNLEPGIEALKGMLKELQTFLNDMGANVDLESWQGIGKAVGEFAGWIIKLGAIAFTDVIHGLDTVGKAIGTFAAGVSLGDFSMIVDPILQLMAVFTPGLPTMISDVGTAFSSLAKGAFDKFDSALFGAAKKFDKFVADLKGLGPKISDGFNAAWDEIQKFWDSVSLVDIGVKLMDSLIEGLKSAAGKIKSALTGVWNDAVSAIATKLPVGGESFAKRLTVGEQATGGLVRGGQPYLVGERGPELIAPSAAGKVIPNHHLFDNLSGLFSGGGLLNKLSGGLPFGNMLSGGLGGLFGNLLQGIVNPLVGGIFDLLGGGRRPSISLPMPGGQTVNVTVNIPAGLSNPDQVRRAAADGIMGSVDNIKRAINDIYHDERRLSFA